MKPASLFISYSHKDEQFREELVSHLAPLKRAGFIDAWHDRCIRPGMDWAAEIDHKIDEAQVVILLVSADFLASNYCYERELARALERHQAGLTVVIPVVIRSVLWEQTPLSRLQALPRDARPVEEWKYRDRAWSDVVRGILNAINGVFQQGESARSLAQTARSAAGLPPERLLDSDTLDEDEAPSGDLADNWDDLRQLRRVSAPLATALAEYRRDSAALKSMKQADYNEMMEISHLKMPIELSTYLIALVAIRNHEERIKVSMKLLKVLSLLEEARKSPLRTIQQVSLNPTSLGLKEHSFEDCLRELSKLVSESTELIRPLPEMARLVREVVLDPVRKLSG